MDAKGAIATAAVFLIAIAVVLPAIQNSVNDSILEICPNVPGVGPSPTPTATPSPTPTPPIIWNDIYDCDTIIDPGYYHISTPIIEQDLEEDCIDITSDNVTLDCNGTVILGPGTSSGVYISGDNVTVYNCTIAYFSQGIWDQGNDGDLYINWLGYNWMGIYLDGTTGMNLTDNDAISNFAFGILIDGGGNNTLTGNDVEYNGDGVLLYETSGNVLMTTQAINNTYAGIFFDFAVNNTLNQSLATDNVDYGIIFTAASEDNIIDNNTATTNGVLDFECIDAFNQTDGGNTCGTVGGCVDPPGPADWLTSCPPP